MAETYLTHISFVTTPYPVTKIDTKLKRDDNPFGLQFPLYSAQLYQVSKGRISGS